MPDALELHRLQFRYDAQGVDCWTRIHFVNVSAYPDTDFASKMTSLLAAVGDRFRAMLAQDATVREAVAFQPRRPSIAPFIQGGNAAGARIGNSLPAMVYHQLQFWGVYSAGEPAIRNSMKISGISAVDARENHMLVNLELTKIAFCQFLRDTPPSISGTVFQWRVARKTPGGAPNSYQTASVVGFTTPTALHALKSRRQ